MLRYRSRWLTPVAGAVVLACSSQPVRWTGERSLQSSVAGVSLAADGAFVDDSLARRAATVTPPAPLCAGSLRLARAGRILYAAWWSPRSDSLARLLSARSNDGGATWEPAAAVDTTDHGATGCHREAPSIAADSSTGYVHVAYALLAPEGPGLFFSHSMDGGKSFHAPVPIVYGDKLGRTSVAASGDLVTVAFEDPNSVVPRVGLAISRSMGHIFEDRLLPVSDDNGAAARPLVALQGHRVSVAWQERVAANGDVVLRVRTGTVH